MKRHPRPGAPAHERGGEDFEWPPGAESLEACEFVSLDRAAKVSSPQPAAPPRSSGTSGPSRPQGTRRRAGPGEELIWPPPASDLDAIEIGAADAPTLVVPAPRPRPKGPRIEAVLDRRMRPAVSAPPKPANARAGTAVALASTLQTRPPAVIQVAVLALTLVTVSLLGLWALWRATPDPFGWSVSRPGIQPPTPFRALLEARPEVSVQDLLLTVDVPLPPTAPLTESAASMPGTPASTVELEPDIPVQEHVAESDPAPAVPSAPLLPADGFDPARVVGRPVPPPARPPTPPGR
jgi:hypothetical protein